MQRIKIPFGGLNAAQLEMLADLCEEYSDGIAHVTTRQDVQLHFIHIEDTPALMRRLASVGITTREACGNSVRNVTACPIAGVCREQTFDVTPYAKAITYFMLGHPDAQEFGRKFKIAFSGCKRECLRAGAAARLRRHRGHARSRTARPGADSSCGSAAVSVRCRSRPGCTTNSFPKKRSCRIAQAIARVFARLGEKKNRNTARLKFLVSKLGIEEFKQLVSGGTRNPALRSTLDRLSERRPATTRKSRSSRLPCSRSEPSTRKVSTSGTPPTSTGSASRATPRSRSRCRWATSPPPNSAWSPMLRAST